METMNDLLVDLINSIGGSKVVGVQLWPELLVDAAQRKLLDCLNPERPAKLDPEQVLYIFSLARQQGVHTAMEFLAHRLFYMAPQPIQPPEEAAQLQRQFIQATAELQRMAARIQELTAVDQQQASVIRSTRFGG